MRRSPVRSQRFLAGVSALALAVTQLALPPPATADNEREIHYFHPDHLGSTALVTNQQGQVVERVTYKPFGEVHTREVRDPTTGQLIPFNMAPSVTPTPFGFTGQRHDSSTGLYYYHARYYDPSLGRFIQPDTLVQAPADPQTLNRYSYVRNNPLKFIDPSGHSFWSIFKRIWLALITFGQSELIPLTTSFLVSLSGYAGINPKYTLALYSAALGAATGGIGWGVGAAISGGVTAFGTNLALDSGEGRQLTRKVAKEFFIDVVGMSPRSAYMAASIVVATGISTALSLGTQTAHAIYKKVVGYDVTWEKGGPAVRKLRFDPPREGANNVGVGTNNMHPSGVLSKVYHQIAEEGGITSKAVNEVPIMNAFSGFHDQAMRYIGMASGPLSSLTVKALNFPTMPPALAMTYAALTAPNSFAVGVTIAANTAISGYAQSLWREQGHE